MSPGRSEVSAWLRKLVVHVGSPAVIGAVVAFIATQVLEARRDARLSTSSFSMSQQLDDDKRIDEIRKIVSPPAETCKEVLTQYASFEDASHGMRTAYGKSQLIPFVERLSDKKKLCVVFQEMNKMPNGTSIEIAQRIAFIQQALNQFPSFFGTTQLSQKLETLRSARSAVTEAEAEDERRRKNAELARLAEDEASRLRAAQAAANAAAAAARARQEGEAFDRILQRNFKISR